MNNAIVVDFAISFCRFTFLKTKGSKYMEKHLKPQKPLSQRNQPPQYICKLPSQLNSSYTLSGLQQTPPQEASCNALGFPPFCTPAQPAPAIHLPCRRPQDASSPLGLLRLQMTSFSPKFHGILSISIDA